MGGGKRSDDEFSGALAMCLRERAEQVLKHGYTAEVDDKRKAGELARVAAWVIEDARRQHQNLAAYTPTPCPFAPEVFSGAAWQKIVAKPIPNRLVVAAAMLLAEADREMRNPTATPGLGDAGTNTAATVMNAMSSSASFGTLGVGKSTDAPAPAPAPAPLRRRVVYVAGRFRGDDPLDHSQVHRNVRRAEAVALRCWKLGLTALCPHLNTAHFSGALPDDAWLVGDLALLERCDGVVLVTGWERSRSAVAEVDHARMEGIPVFLSPEAAVDHFLVDDRLAEAVRNSGVLDREAKS